MGFFVFRNGGDVKRVKLRYRVVPEELRDKTYVSNPVKVRILNSDMLVSMGFLGESGKKMADAGLMFYFEKEDAKKLIRLGLAKGEI